MFNLFQNILNASSAWKALWNTGAFSGVQNPIAPVTQAFWESNVVKKTAPIIQQAWKEISSVTKPFLDTASKAIKPIKKEFDYSKQVFWVKTKYAKDLMSLGLTAQTMDEMWFSDEEKQAVKSIYDQVWATIPWLEEQAMQQQPEEVQNMYWSSITNPIQNVVGWITAQIPSAIGNTASFLSKAGQYTPAWLLWSTIEAWVTDKSFSDVQQKKNMQAEKLAEIGQKGKEFYQKYGAYNPESTSAKAGWVITDIGTAFVWPNKIAPITKLWKLAKPIQLALEGALWWAKYDVTTKWEVTPQWAGIWAWVNLALWGITKIPSVIKKALPESVKLPEWISKKTADVLKRLIPDSFTSTDLTNLKASWKIESWKWLSWLKNTYIPSKDEISIAETIAPYVNPNWTTTENISKLRDAIKNEAESLKSAISSQNPIIPKRQVTSHIKNALDKIMENPEMTIWDNPKLVNKLIEKYKALLDEEWGTALGVLNARQRFDAYIKNFRPKTFDSPTWSVYDSAVREVRNSANDLLDSLVLNKSAKESLKMQSQMFKAIDMFAGNKDITTFGKILKNPIARWFWAWIIGGAWFSALSDF